MLRQDLRRLGGVLLSGRLHDGHDLHRRPREAEALSGRQSGGRHDLDLDEAVVPATDAIYRDATQPLATPELVNAEFAGGQGDDLPGWGDGSHAGEQSGQGDLVSANLSGPTAGDSTSPAGIVIDCDIAREVPAIAAAPGMTALVLVRLFTEPIGMLTLDCMPGSMPAESLAQAIADELAHELAPRLGQCGLPFSGTLPVDGLEPPRTPPFIASRARVHREGPEITVAICTRNRIEGLERTVRSLAAQEYPRVQILVVDNDPSDDATRDLAARLAGEIDLDYVVEPRRGLSWARNRAIEVARTEVVAWADDDEVCDRWWASEVARAFVEVPEAQAVTGLVAAAELQTETQLWFERYSGVWRGRGFRRGVFSPATRHLQSPLYPLPPFGAGANMSFRREAIQRIGRFDVALGAGRATMAGEDTAALSMVMVDGGTVVYQPTAVVHHSHRRDLPALEKVMLGYGRGLSAYYASMVLRRPRVLPELARLSRRALTDQLSNRGTRLTDLQGFPEELLALNRKGLLQGALIYPGVWLRSKWLARGATDRSSR